MKLGMIVRPQPKEFDHLKELGLDFAEFDFNPTQYFGQSVEQIREIVPQLKEASLRTGVEGRCRWPLGKPSAQRRWLDQRRRMEQCPGNYQGRQRTGRKTLSVQRCLCPPADLLLKTSPQLLQLSK